MQVVVYDVVVDLRERIGRRRIIAKVEVVCWFC
jgi:hypothetical protein